MIDPKTFGALIFRLRKRAGYTQASLAEKLNLSDKTVCKWENGLGFPDITQLPALAHLLGVTVDCLFSEQNVGIAIAGNMIADSVKSIRVFPQVGMLTNIESSKLAIGGCAPNTATDLAVIDGTLPVSVYGRVGDDENGNFMLSKLKSRGIDVSGVLISDKTPTSFCDVMSLPTSERTFFSFSGANAEFSPEDVDVAALSCKIFHIGYILLLDRFDAPDAEYGTVMARFLHSLQKQGIKTSIDAVSSTRTEDYAEKLRPAFAYADYVIINEIECCNAWNLDPRLPDGTPNEATIREAMEKTMACGVSEKVIVHLKEGGYCLDATGAFTKVGSLKIPREEIRGSVGAGDAFCAGCLYALYHGYSDPEMLQFASAAAACNLFAENSVDGMRSKKEIEKLCEQYERRAL